jgi:hypothetical protein
MRDSGEVPGSLVRVLATEGKTPLKDAANSSPQRTKKTTERSKVSRNRIIAGSVGAAVLLGGIFFLTRGGGSIGGSSEPTGPVQFELQSTGFIPYQPHGDQGAQKDTAHRTGEDIAAQLDHLFETAYVDRGTWGDTGQIDDFFTGGAKGSLENNIQTLTLGENASDAYTSVEPGKSTLGVKVLTGADGTPVRASARLTFKAVAERDDGTSSAITVTGTAIFVKDGDTWKIEAYHLSRSEKPTKASAASTSPTSEAP